jgi:1,4-dihydroxy-2-naphthoate octaprenyltransferase
VWAYATVVLPLAFFHVEPELNEIFLFVNRMLLVALATMIFDYRDKLRDFESGVHTPANLLNEKQFGLFFMINVLFYLFTVVFLACRFHNKVHLLQLIPGLVLIYLLRESKRQDNDLFYLGWVDGVLILSSLLSLFLLI